MHQHTHTPYYPYYTSSQQPRCTSSYTPTVYSPTMHTHTVILPPTSQVGFLTRHGQCCTPLLLLSLGCSTTGRALLLCCGYCCCCCCRLRVCGWEVGQCCTTSTTVHYFYHCAPPQPLCTTLTTVHIYPVPTSFCTCSRCLNRSISCSASIRCFSLSLSTCS